MSDWNNDQLDGRDALIKQYYKNRKDLVTAVQKPDKALEGYEDPWGIAYYNQFDDLLPKRVAEYRAVVISGVVTKNWRLPVTDIDRHDGGHYDQLSLGTVEIREVPAADGGTELRIRIVNDEDA